MRYHLSIFILIFIFSTPLFGQNLIPNPGMELGTGNDFDNWSKYNGAANLLATTIPGEFQSGSRGLKAVVDGMQANAGQPWSVQLVSDLIPTSIGSTYTLTVYAKALNNNGSDIRFSTQPNALYSADYVLTDMWTAVTWTFTANETATMIVLDLGENNNTYFLDDFELIGAPTDCAALPNNGFEAGIADEFSNWYKYNGTASFTATSISGEFRSGTRALKAEVAANGNPWEVQMASDLIPTVVGAGYSFSIYIKALTPGTDIRFSTNPSPLYSANYTVTDEWTKYTWSFTANEPMTRILLDLGEFANTYYLDDGCFVSDCGGGFVPPLTQSPIASGKNKFLGCIYSDSQKLYANNYFNQVTPENSGKWGSVEISDGVYDWTAIDEAREYAALNGFPFRYHVLLWGSQQPTWLKPLSDADKVQNIKDWMQAVHDHFDGSTNARAKLEYIEVMNEIINDPPNDGPNATAQNPWANDNTNDASSGGYVNALKSLNAELGTTPGPYDWIVNGFKLARETFGCEAKLILNEFNVANISSVTTDYVTIINLLKADHLIDIVGMQGHSFSTQKYDDSQSFANHSSFLESSLNTLAGTGLPIIITELDIDGDASLDANGVRIYTGTQAEQDAFQKAEYERIFGLFWNHPSVIGITLWGYRPGHWRSDREAYLIDPCTGAERPALAEYLNATIRDGNNPALGNSFTPTICADLLTMTVSCESDIPAGDPNLISVCTTNCAGQMTITFQDTGSPTGTPTGPYTITRTYTANDGCGNVNSIEQLFNVTYEYTMSSGTMLTGTQLVSTDVEADGRIESNQIITGMGTAVDYDSGLSILLASNFEVKSGSIFHGFINGCGGI